MQNRVYTRLHVRASLMNLQHHLQMSRVVFFSLQGNKNALATKKQKKKKKKKKKKMGEEGKCIKVVSDDENVFS